MTRYDISGDYRRCPVCAAPFVSPFPDTWTLDLIKEGTRHGPVQSFLTPHAEQCDAPTPDPQPGIAVWVPGSVVTRMDVAWPPVPDDVGYLHTTTPGGVWPEEWVLLGYTSEGLVSDDGVTWHSPGVMPEQLPTDTRIVFGGGTLWYSPVGDAAEGTFTDGVPGE